MFFVVCWGGGWLCCSMPLYIFIISCVRKCFRTRCRSETQRHSRWQLNFPELTYRPDWWPKGCPMFVNMYQGMVYIWYFWYFTYMRYCVRREMTIHAYILVSSFTQPFISSHENVHHSTTCLAICLAAYKAYRRSPIMQIVSLSMYIYVYKYIYIYIFIYIYV